MAFAKNRGADADDRRAFLDGYLEIVAHAHRQFPEHFLFNALAGEIVSQFVQRREVLPRSIRIDGRGRQQHEAGYAGRFQLTRSVEDAREFLGSGAMFRRFPGEIDLHQQLRTTACVGGRIVQPRQQIGPID